MKARKGLKWLAAGLVMAASMVLLGCPHNNVIEHDVVSGSGATTGRGSNDGVKLVITNFTDGSQNDGKRTIVADHIDLKAEKDKYVFIAEGTSNGGDKYGPEYITLEDDGSAALGIAGSGIWTIKVSAYDVQKLQAVGNGVTGTTNTDIMQQTDSSLIITHGADALVLRGSAVMNLAMSSTGTVSVTLTNDGVGTDGNVKVSVYFDDTNDRNKLDSGTGNNYSVVVGLYDFATGNLIKEDEIKPLGQTLANPDVTDISDVPKGRYQFRVTVKDDSNNPVTYWVDDIIVDANRDVTEEVHISKLFETPTTPTSAGVYWSQKESGSQEGFLAYLSWNGMPFNAIGVDVQIANITQWYKFAQTNDQIDFAGAPENITDAQTLWEKIDARNGLRDPSFEDIVTDLKWSDVPQNANKYPAIWKSGSLLNGDSGVVFQMQTGQVYSVRIRAAGATDSSDWLIVDNTTSVGITKPKMLVNAIDNTSGSEEAKDFDTTKLSKGIFGLVMLKYDLQSKYELAKTEAGLKGTKATAKELVVYSPYGTPISIDLKYTNMTTPQADEWFLYPIGAATIDDRSKSWKGWKSVENPIQSFEFPAWGDYSGHTDLTLIAVGAGANVNVQAETPGTFDTLTDANILVDIVGIQGSPLTLDELNAGTHATGDVKTIGTGLLHDTTRYILSLDAAAKGGTGGTASWLYVSVGKDAASAGTLTDKNGNDFTVKDITVEIVQNGLTVVKSFTKDSPSQAHAHLDGMASGTYTLKVRVLTSAGYWVSYNTPLAIKYNNQTI